MREYELLLGRAMRGPILDTWSRRGMEDALRLIEDVDREDDAIRVRWVWLDATQPDRFAPRAPVEGAGALPPAGRSSVVAGEGGGAARLVSLVPLSVPGNRPGALELSESLWKQDARAATAVRRLSVLLAGLLVASALTIFFLGVKLVGKPLARILAKVRRVGEGELSGPLELGGAGELNDVARGLNEMCEQLTEAQGRVAAETNAKIQALDQLRHADRLRTVGRLASGIAHELGTPLNVVSGRAALISSGKLDLDQARESAEIIRSQAERIARIIRQLLDYARRRPSRKGSMDVGRVVASACELIAPAAKKEGVTLSWTADGDERKLARGNEAEIQQVISNLLVNAMQSIPSGGAVTVEVGRVHATPPRSEGGAAGPHVRVAVSDEGAGIAAEDLPRIFEPFFTTKDVGIGTGLGLSIVYGILRDHAGWIEVESDPGAGSRFVFYLPEESA